MIDYCSFLYLNSSFLPISNIKLINLSNLLLKYFNENIFKLSNIIKLQNSNYSHSILFGYFISFLWSLNPNYLSNLFLDFEINFDFNSLSKQTSLLDADVSSPKFPDTIPLLLISFTKMSIIQITTLDNARLLIIYLILINFNNFSNHFLNDFWKIKLNERIFSIFKTLKYFYYSSNQLLNFDSLFISNIKKKYFIINIIEEEFIKFQKNFKNLKLKYFHLEINPNKIIFQKKNIFQLSISNINSLIFNSTNTSQIALLANGNLSIYEINLNINKLSLLSIIYDTNHFNFILSHPNFPIFLTSDNNHLYLFEFNGKSLDYKFNILNIEKIISISFSPNGKLLGICSNHLFLIIPFDLSTSIMNPIFEKYITNNIQNLRLLF